ncbi:MAG: A24 family peptidase [Lachnospiraceae bacterium]|nr:A24 family peptidase [Lachnospiraceae bacterium]
MFSGDDILSCILAIIMSVIASGVSNLVICFLYSKEEKEDEEKNIHALCQSCKNEYSKVAYLFPFLRKKKVSSCPNCGSMISNQFIVMQLLNIILYIATILYLGLNLETVLLCLFITALITISMVDFRIYEIPDSYNLFILILGIFISIIDRNEIVSHLIGMVVISGFLFLVALISVFMGREAMGGGDIKLMFASGLVLGVKGIVVAFIVGCIAGSVIHLVRMLVTKADHQLSFGPYLAMGMVYSVFFGERTCNWYLNIISAYGRLRNIM